MCTKRCVETVNGKLLFKRVSHSAVEAIFYNERTKMRDGRRFFLVCERIDIRKKKGIMWRANPEQILRLNFNELQRGAIS